MRILAVDLGTRRIGFAVSTFGGISVPFATRELKSPSDALAAVHEVAQEAEAEMVLLGLPLNMDGTEGEMAEKARSLGAALADKSGLVTAERIMIEADVSRGKRRKSIDKMAAQIFLQDYLDSNAGQDH